MLIFVLRLLLVDLTTSFLVLFGFFGVLEPSDCPSAVSVECFLEVGETGESCGVSVAISFSGGEELGLVDLDV